MTALSNSTLSASQWFTMALHATAAHLWTGDHLLPPPQAAHTDQLRSPVSNQVCTNHMPSLANWQMDLLAMRSLVKVLLCLFSLSLVLNRSFLPTLPHCCVAYKLARCLVTTIFLCFAVPASSSYGSDSSSGQAVGRRSEETKHPHLDKILHPFQHTSG